MKNQTLLRDYKDLQQKCITADAEYRSKVAQLKELTEDKKISEDSFSAYAKILDSAYKEKELEFDKLMYDLQSDYEVEKDILENKIKDLQKELDDIKNARRLAYELMREEKRSTQERKEKCIPLTEEEINDILKLNKLKPQLSNPRILSMLIWQTYVQKKLKKISLNELGADKVTGIYKITNINTNECYIGQSLDTARRWSDHAKCGLGIDTPAQNKLYEAMKNEGIWNFSWELIEKCEDKELNKKERYYIDLYDSVNAGYNMTKGNK